MNYQPFLDMHLLVSDELLLTIPVLFNAFLILVIAAFAFWLTYLVFNRL